MIHLIFMILCGCLYLVGLPFGWSYQESSVYICIYACPIICILSAVASLIFCDFKTWGGRFRFSVNSTLLITYIMYTQFYWKFFNGVHDSLSTIIYGSDPFEICVRNINYVATHLNISYEECNLRIYCMLFPFIVLFHILQLFIFKHKCILKNKQLF